MHLGISKRGGLLASIEVSPNFIEIIITKKFDDEDLLKVQG